MGSANKINGINLYSIIIILIASYVQEKPKRSVCLSLLDLTSYHLYFLAMHLYRSGW